MSNLRQPPRQRRLLIAAVLALMNLPVRAEVVTVVFDGERRFSHRFDVAPGKIAEACGQLPQHLTVQWRFSADSPLDFNIHHHEGKAVDYSVKLVASTGAQGELRVDAKQPYCWMWKNNAVGPASVSLELVR